MLLFSVNLIRMIGPKHSSSGSTSATVDGKGIHGGPYRVQLPLPLMSLCPSLVEHPQLFFAQLNVQQVVHANDSPLYVVLEESVHHERDLPVNIGSPGCLFCKLGIQGFFREQPNTDLAPSMCRSLVDFRQPVTCRRRIQPVITSLRNDLPILEKRVSRGHCSNLSLSNWFLFGVDCPS